MEIRKIARARRKKTAQQRRNSGRNVKKGQPAKKILAMPGFASNLARPA